VQFSEDGETISVNVTITIDPTDPVELNGVGSLVSTGTADARLRSASEWAARTQQ